MFLLMKFFVISTLTGLVFVDALPAKDGTKKKEQENSGQLIDREQLQQAGMEVGQSWTQTAGENMMALGKEEFQYGVHKIEDRIDKEGERVIDIQIDDSRDEAYENNVGTDFNNYNDTFETFSFPRPLKLTHSPKYLNSDLLRTILSNGAAASRRIRRSDGESVAKAAETQSPSGKPPDFSSLTGSNPFNISSLVTPSSGGSSSQTAMMIIGGFTALMMPVQGAAANPNNIGNMLQMAQFVPGSGGGAASNPLTSQG